MRVSLDGWRPPLLTISLIDLVRQAKGQGLKTAKTEVERLVDGIPLEVAFPDVDSAQRFLKQAEAVGAIGHIVVDT